MKTNGLLVPQEQQNPCLTRTRSHYARQIKPFCHARQTVFLSVPAIILLLIVSTIYPPYATADVPEQIRFATYNASLYRKKAGGLIKDLKTGKHTQIRAVAEIIQRVRPDILLLNEFDYDGQGPEQTSLAAKLFQQNYLAVGQNNAKPIHYPHVYCAPSNTGISSGFDLDNNGRFNDPEDAFGFGRFEGQYGMLILSKYPIFENHVRTFQKFLWKDMPNALLPDDSKTPEKNDWFSSEELNIVRLSSKSHWDIPVDVAGKTIHVLASHPVPPVFDGPEDYNGKRNHDEIRFWADYISQCDYIYDDQKQKGALVSDASFIIMGDLNADPDDGDSVPGTVKQLLKHPRINASVTPSSKGALEANKLQGNAKNTKASNAMYSTSNWGSLKNGGKNLRVDYVLPSNNLKIVDANVFWPVSKDPLHHLLKSSDHRMTWVDILY